MDIKKEFLLQAIKSNRNMAQLCRYYNIDRKTGYKWLARFVSEGFAGLEERSRKRSTAHPSKHHQK